MADSVSEWFGCLKAGESEAAQKLWERYAHELADLARTRLGKLPKTAADEDDIAQSVFGSICRGAAAGRFADVKTRDELWWLLLTITKQKTVNLIRREMAIKRGSGRVQTECSLAGCNEGTGRFSLDELAGVSPTPEFLVMLEEQYVGLLQMLRDDRLRQIAIWRIEGYTVEEIAAKLGIGKRAVARKLQLIRTKWAGHLSQQKSQP